MYKWGNSYLAISRILLLKKFMSNTKGDSIEAVSEVTQDDQLYLFFSLSC